jgi:integrase
VSLYKRGKIWWYTFVKDGNRYQISTGSTNKDIAKRAEARKLTELDEGRNNLPSKRKPITLQAAAMQWMETRRADWSESNFNIQTYNLKHLNTYLGSEMLNAITAERIGKYKSLRKDQSASNRTINMEVGTVRMILKHFRLWRAIEEDVKMLREDQSKGKALSPNEERRLLEACGRSPQPSLLTAVVIFSNTGLRNSELRCARWSQVDLERRVFQVARKAKTEGSALRIIPLNLAALGALKAWRELWPDAQPDDFIFPTQKLVFKGKGAVERGVMTGYAVDHSKPLGSWKTAWRSAKASAGVECRIHDLRHGLISKLAEQGASLPTIKAISGHTTAQMVELYTHIRPEAQREALAMLDAPVSAVR